MRFLHLFNNDMVTTIRIGGSAQFFIVPSFLPAVFSLPGFLPFHSFATKGRSFLGSFFKSESRSRQGGFQIMEGRLTTDSP